MMKKFFFIVYALNLYNISCSQDQHVYHIVKTYRIASPGGWDYVALNNNKLYVSHGTQVNILNESTGDSIGVIPNTTGVHGIAFVNTLNKGFTSNGRLNNVFIFNLTTNEILGQIVTGENPDAILFEPYSKTIITCNGKSKDLTVIDPKSGKVIATIPVGGKPEATVADEEGKLFVNIEDKNEIAVVNTKSFIVENHWSLAPGESPTGLAFDNKTKRLFSGCDNKLLIVMDAANGKIVEKLPIGDGCDGVAFDKDRQLIFTSNGEGNITVIKENSASEFKVVATIPTKRGARTLTLDQQSHTLFTTTADFETDDAQTGRPKMIPGTFQVLVLQ